MKLLQNFYPTLRICCLTASGIEITLHHLFPSRNDFVERNDLAPYYDLFEMTNIVT